MTTLAPTHQRFVVHPFLVIFDEFEEINDALFVGDNVRRFTAGLRSLSELGLTFFLAGSERIRSIKELSSDFNHWGLYNLGRIESHSDLRSLIEEPVSAAIEFAKSAVDRIVEYFQGNPFYTVLLCDYIYKQCARGQKTHVSKTYVDSVIDEWLRKRTLVENFSHFWEDEPALDPNIRARHQAESALAIACVSVLGGRYNDVSDVVDAQERFDLDDHQVLSVTNMRGVLTRLRERQVLKATDDVRHAESGRFDLDVFRDWMAVSGARRELVDRWRRLRLETGSGIPSPVTPRPRSESLSRGSRDGWQLPVHDADVHRVSEALNGAGVTFDKLKAWLRQFNEDEVVHVAWKLVKRLAESGYKGPGYQRTLAIEVCQGIEARRRVVSHRPSWAFGPRGKRIDLCLVWLDDGAAAPARLIEEIIKPGMKTGNLGRVAPWIQQRRDRRRSDPVLALVDDFAGTGRTLLARLERLGTRLGKEYERLVDEGRVICCVLAAFSEAVEAVQEAHPTIRVVAGEGLRSDLRAFDPEARIFESTDELTYARRVIHAIGMEIMPSMPLGFDGMGALVALGNRCPNNSLPVFWSEGTAKHPWIPLFARPG